MEKLTLWGASGHAKVVADIVRAENRYELAGFIDDFSAEAPAEFCGLPVLRTRECLGNVLRQGIGRIIIAVGDCQARVRLACMARDHGFSLGVAIHPRATVASGVSVGAGTVIAAGAVVNPGTVIGENVIVNTSASVDHDCVVEDGAHVGPGCHLGGWVRVGRESWLGIGSIVRDRVRIGSGTMVGAGAVAVGDLPDGVVAYGVPAKVIRRVTDGI